VGVELKVSCNLWHDTSVIEQLHPRTLYPRRDPLDRTLDWSQNRREEFVIPPGIEHQFPGRPTRKNRRTGTTFRLPLLPFLSVHVPHQECSISSPSTDRSRGTGSPNSPRRHAVTRSSGEAILIRVTAAVSGKDGGSLHRPHIEPRPSILVNAYRILYRFTNHTHTPFTAQSIQSPTSWTCTAESVSYECLQQEYRRVFRTGAHALFKFQQRTDSKTLLRSTL